MHIALQAITRLNFNPSARAEAPAGLMAVNTRPDDMVGTPRLKYIPRRPPGREPPPPPRPHFP